MGYTNCINITDALWFGLFDDVPYKWLKEVLDKKMDWDEYDFEVEITDVPLERELGEVMEGGLCATKFDFELRWNDEIWGSEKKWKTQTFTKIIEYNCSGEVALKLCKMDDDYEEEEESSDGTLFELCELCLDNETHGDTEYCKECYEKYGKEEEDDIDEKKDEEL